MGEGVVEMESYRDLLAWQKGMAIVKTIYVQTKAWPHEELVGLTSQIRRAAVSVPANIAEGQGHTGKREFAHHLSIAKGSVICTISTGLFVTPCSRRQKRWLG